VLQHLVNSAADLTRVHPATSSTQEKRAATASFDHLTSAELHPTLQGGGRGHPERHRPLLGSLAHNTYQVGAEGDVVHIQTHQLTNPNPTGIQQLQHRAVSQMHRVLVVSGNCGHIQRSAYLVLFEHSWQGLHAAGGYKTQ
jgi:hypothetical protein